MSSRERRQFLILAAIWILELALFWGWWLKREHDVDHARFLVNSLLIFWSTAAPGYFVGVFARSAVANPKRPPPTGKRVAMVVTKAPSEPFHVVQRTLEAMLRQTWPHDTWLADEDPDGETLAWCAEHGVKVSTRKNVPEYHNATWPRRTRCKEGNLAYFYDNWGYHEYDFVAQLDADHVPEPNYLTEILRPFSDPTVGYVSAPSICDSNAEMSWSARGRLYVEGALHGALQAGHTGGLAPLCIGSHYAVRTAALKAIGGIGPELAEDHSTTLIMNAHGWRGVHALNAIAHGEGPPTFAALATQEFQWSRSLMIVLLRYTGRYFPGLSLKHKSQFLFSQLWYPLFTLFMASTVVLPIIALLTRREWVAISYPDYFLHASLLTASIVALMLWIKSRGWFRPHDAKVLSWEGSVFVFARWPWSLLGGLAGIYDCLTRKEFAFRVTPKGAKENASAPFSIVAPYIGLSLICSVPLLLTDDPSNVAGFYIFSLLNALIYLLLAVLIIDMHHRENGRTKSLFLSLFGEKYPLKGAALVIAFAIAFVGGALRAPRGAEALLAKTSSDIGFLHQNAVTSNARLSLGVYDPAQEFATSDSLAVEHTFISWADPVWPQRLSKAADYARSRGRWLMVTVEPWPISGMPASTLLTDVRRGAYDETIDQFCAAAAAIPTGVFIRWGHEMDKPSGRYPWATAQPQDYVLAYRHFVQRCRVKTQKAKDVFFVWSPTGDALDLPRYYPGEAYVDWVGLSVFNCAHFSDKRCRQTQSFHAAAAKKYDRVKGFEKPVMIAELGVEGSAAAQKAWIADALTEARKLPLLGMMVYFNSVDGAGVWNDGPPPDWRVDPQSFRSGRRQRLGGR